MISSVARKTELRRWCPLLILFASGLLIRVYIFMRITPRLQTDSITYLMLSDVDFIRTPGYPFFLEMIHFVNDLFGLSSDYLGSIIFVQMFVLGLLNCYLTYRLTERLTGKRLFSLVLGLLYNVNYFLLGFEFQILTETLAITFLLLTLLFYSRMFEGKKSASFLAGFFSACLLLIRPVFLLLFAGLLIVTIVVYFRHILEEGFLRKFIQPIAIFLLIHLLAIGAWSLRNKVQYDYFGISFLMPYQLRHYTKHFFHKYNKDEDALLNRCVDIYLEENCNTARFERRLQTEMDMNLFEISRVYMKMNLKIILDFPGDYIKQVPESSADYYRSYSAYWMIPFNKKLLQNKIFLPKILSFFFRLFSILYKNLWTVLVTVVILPLIFLFLVRKNKRVFHLLFLVEAAIHYNFVVSVLSTNSGIDNLRYRVPVEPLILVVAFSSLYHLAKKGTVFFEKWKRGSPGNESQELTRTSGSCSNFS